MNFDTTVQQKIGYYVYRLIDPRDGSTFYVGKGKDNRVFDHVNVNSHHNNEPRSENENEYEYEDDDDLKFATIRAIKEANLEVIHVIHRHGMNEDTAFEVEAALIDAYPGLSNKVGGHGSADRGAMNVQQIQDMYAAKEIKSFDGYNCVIIKIRKANVDGNEGDIYRTVRAAWKLSAQRFASLNETSHYILAVVDGIVKGVYEAAKGNLWKPYQNTGRYAFDALEIPKNAAPASLWLGHRIPSDFRKPGMANPVLLTWDTGTHLSKGV